MRVHRLEISAFGPFAETQVVDFEPLNAAGVFLLTGETGAGKTSVLDAICFGLFGQVPGVRDKAKAYRSQHAGPDAPPRVVLEVTVRGRRLRLTRTPAWARPSRRARAGVVEERARATAEELVDGTWQARSNRVDEVGHLVTSLLGLNREQFCQVVLLPQGDFQAFLRAGARDRQQILETLFGTQHFHAVERWLAEHRRAQSRACRELEERVGQQLARLAEACVPSPSGLGRQVCDLTPRDRDLVSFVHTVIAHGADEVDTSRTSAETSELASKRTRHELDEARLLADHQERHREARRRHAALLALGDVVAASERLVRRARAAAALTPLVSMARASDELVERLDEAVGDALRQATLLGLLPPTTRPSPAGVRELSTQHHKRLTNLESLVQLDQACRELAARTQREAQARAGLAATVDELTAQVDADPGVLADLRTRLDAATGRVQRAGAVALSREHAMAAVTAAREVADHDVLVRQLEGDLLTAREAAATLTEHWLDAREQRLAGMAAELAGLLVDGDGCPVCGSVTHPTPAQPNGRQVTADEEAALHSRTTAARLAVEGLDQRLRERLAARAEAFARTGGQDLASATDQLEVVLLEAARLADADADRARLQVAVDDAEAAANERRARLQEATTHLARRDERIAEWSHQLEVGRATLAEELDGDPSPLPDRLTTAADAIDRLETLADLLRDYDEARRSAGSAGQAVQRALSDSPFDEPEEALAAALTASEIADREALNRTYDAELRQWSRQLADPVLVAAAKRPEPDLPRLVAESAAAEDAATRSAALAAELTRRQERLEALAAGLGELVAELEPLRDARDLADDVASLCAGTSPDNVTRTALSHYVLGARLGQVVAAANLRLESIGGGRYQLEHTMVRGAGDTRGGLGLLMRDTHTDQVRDPATLSGGETFYVSLALALGLADVVTGEAGGVELSTLFVDEGFGSLDDDTRDEVLDELDALRSGGRSVGLVSHLSELRARCPVRLHVVAGPHGSRCLPVPAG